MRYRRSMIRFISNGDESVKTECDIIATAHQVEEASIRPMDRAATLALLAALHRATEAAEAHLQALSAPVVHLR